MAWVERSSPKTSSRAAAYSPEKSVPNNWELKNWAYNQYYPIDWRTLASVSAYKPTSVKGQKKRVPALGKRCPSGFKNRSLARRNDSTCSISPYPAHPQWWHTIRSWNNMTPIGSEMIVSTFPVLKTSFWTFSSSTIPLTILILFFICGFLWLVFDSFTSYISVYPSSKEVETDNSHLICHRRRFERYDLLSPRLGWDETQNTRSWN